MFDDRGYRGRLVSDDDRSPGYCGCKGSSSVARICYKVIVHCPPSFSCSISRTEASLRASGSGRILLKTPKS